MHMQTKQQDSQIFQSIRSEGSQQEDNHQQKPPSKIHQKPQNKKIESNHSNENEIDDNLQFGASIYENKNIQFMEKRKVSNEKSSGSSDWNCDTDQIIDSLKKPKQKPKAIQKVTKTEVKYNQVIVKERIQHKKEVKYPEIHSPNKKTSETNTQHQELSMGNKFQKMRPTLSNYSDEDNEQIDINASMIGQRSKVNFKDKSEKKEQQNNRKVQTKNNPVVNPTQNPVEQQKIMASQFKSIYLSNTKAEKTNCVSLKLMDTTMYWMYDNKQIKVQVETLEAMVEQFYKKQIMLPLVSLHQFNSTHIYQYMKRYTEFLNDMFPEQFKATFNVIKSSLQSGAKMNIASKSLTSKPSNSISQMIYDQYVTKLFKNSNYSKAEIVRNHLIKKLDNLIMLEKSQFLKSKINQKSVDQKKQLLKNQISLLEMLVSFENSEKYCHSNLEGIDQAIWKNHIKQLGLLKKRWVKKLQERKQGQLIFKI